MEMAWSQGTERGLRTSVVFSTFHLAASNRSSAPLPSTASSLTGSEFHRQRNMNILRPHGLSHRSLVATNVLQLALPTGLFSMQLRCKIASLKSSPLGISASPFKALVD